MAKNDGGKPAFPLPNNIIDLGGAEYRYSGMTVRTWLAGQVAPGIASHYAQRLEAAKPEFGDKVCGLISEIVARVSVRIADALLAELAKEPEGG